jgi:hypothetical protein
MGCNATQCSAWRDDMADDEEKQLRLELLAADIKLRRKQEFWETPRNIAILVGVSATIAAAIGFWLGRESATPSAPLVSPVLNLGSFNSVRPDQFMDAIQTAGIITIAAVLIYVVIRLERAITAAAKELKGAIGEQQALGQAINRVLARIEAVEHLVWERNEILPTTRLRQTLEEINSRLEQLEKGGE